LHGFVFAAKLNLINVKPAQEGANPGISATPVQDTWEKTFKELGDDNPEKTVTGMFLFYPQHMVGYLEVL
jgi:hypothetical protein